METQQPHENRKETDSLRLAGAAVAVLSLGAIAFFCAYSFAGFIYPAPSPAQTASVIETQEQPDPFASTTLIAKSAYVLDLTTGKDLYSQNANAQLPLASLTKVALVLAVSGALQPDTLIATPAKYDAPPGGGTARLPAGQTWALSDVISFTLTASSDDGADLLASSANDTIHQQFPQSPQQNATVWRMNNIAQQLGLTNTYFLNDSGLDLSTTQSGAYGSAHDMAILYGYAATTSPGTFGATAQPQVTVRSTTGTVATGVNTDTVLDKIPGIIMGKTGYTDLAGGNLAIVFTTGGHEVVAIVLGSTQDGRFTDMEQLIPAAQEAVQQGK
ncbi:MAG: serine hydrolase [Candidatus Pacebacteria bacterium]|nr:serine hydrolase [Candidatus Paceibacterota bacterium]